VEEEVLTFGLVPKFDGEEAVDLDVCYLCCSDRVGNVIMATIKPFEFISQAPVSFKINSPITTVPGYVLARSINLGPNVNEAGASSGEATEYVTYADDAASYVARSLLLFSSYPSITPNQLTV
jgi:hypothetical protein